MTALLKKTDRVRCAAFENGRWSRQEHAYELFKSGMDTFDIGRRLKVHESIVCRWIDRERNSNRKGISWAHQDQ